jgi:hypothetical protein
MRRVAIVAAIAVALAAGYALGRRARPEATTAAASAEPLAAEELDLARFERNVNTQFGEDGVLEKIFEVVEPTHRFVVEFGAYDGVTNSNPRNLVVEHGWRGLQIEGDAALAQQLARNYADHPEVKTLHAWVYPGNIEILLEENGVPRDFDLLVIDIDSNDYYVWRAIQSFRPKVVLIEYNPAYPPPERAVVDFHPMNYWDGTDYHGASIQSLVDLAARKGYELVYGNQAGNNLFFVDAPYFPRFGIRDNSPERFYHPPAFGLTTGGRAPNGRGLPPSPPGSELEWEAFRIPKRMVER